MERVTYDILNLLFSKARITPYLKNNNSAEYVLAEYHQNIILSEAMIPTLHYFEVCLRNRIDQVFKRYYSQNWLLNLPADLMISNRDIKKIEEVILKISKESKRLPMHDDIVAQMTFGFWYSFFHRKYDPIIWHRKDALKTLFPNLPRASRKRAYVEAKIFCIKEIRNRIAHHEPILNLKTPISYAYTTCHELIAAMSYEAANMLKAIDRFPEVFKKIIK